MRSTISRLVGGVVAAITVGGGVSVSGGFANPAAASPARLNSASEPSAPSSGCQAATAPNPGESTLSFSANGKSGTYIQDVPTTTGTNTPMPVVFDLHGYLEAASIEHTGTGLSAFGDTHGFVTITPQLDESGVPRWDVGPHSADIAYIGSLLSQVEGSLCIDQRRVFVTGLSMGAFTTSAIACELSGRVAAVAPVAGLQAFSWCRPSRPVPVVAFQGTADPFVSYTGGPGPNALKLPAPDGSGETVGQELKAHPNAAGNPLPQSIPTQVATWAKRNGCGSSATRTSVASDVTLVTYPCAANGSVKFYVIRDGGHSWPGGTSGIYPPALVGRTTMSISADQIIWGFFEAHPLAGHVA
jgi:polyhydroxybutyrate depolymerase